MGRKRLGELLLEAGVIDEMQLQSALGAQRRFGQQLGRVLVEMGAVSEDALVNVLSHQLKIPAVQLTGRRLDDAALRLLDMKFCQRNACIPFGYNESGRFLDVALADPTNQETFDQIRVKTRCNVRPYLAGPIAIELAIRLGYTGESLPTEAPAVGPHGADWGRIGDRVLDLDASGEPPQTAPVAGPVAGRTLTGPAASARSRPATMLQPTPTAPRAPRPETARRPPPTAAVTPVPDSDGVARLQAELAQLRALLERDEKVLRRLMALLIDKGVCSREELMTRINED